MYILSFEIRGNINQAKKKTLEPSIYTLKQFKIQKPVTKILLVWYALFSRKMLYQKNIYSYFESKETNFKVVIQNDYKTK